MYIDIFSYYLSQGHLGVVYPHCKPLYIALSRNYRVICVSVPDSLNCPPQLESESESFINDHSTDVSGIIFRYSRR